MRTHLLTSCMQVLSTITSSYLMLGKLRATSRQACVCVCDVCNACVTRACVTCV